MPLNVELKGLVVVIYVEGLPVIQWEEKMANLAGAYNYQHQGKNEESYFVRNAEQDQRNLVRDGLYKVGSKRCVRETSDSVI